MRTLYLTFAALLLTGTIQSVSVAQTANLTETFKMHFNETVENVKESDTAVDKKKLLNESFNKLIAAIDLIESRASLTEYERADLATYKFELREKLNELNGLDGYEMVVDEDLDEFSDYSQDSMEQANRTITIGVTTALLILIILLLL